MESEPLDAVELELQVDQLFERTDAIAHAVMNAILQHIRSERLWTDNNSHIIQIEGDA